MNRRIRIQVESVDSIAEALVHDAFNARMKYEMADVGSDNRRYFLGQYEAYYTALQLMECSTGSNKYTDMLKTAMADIIRMKNKGGG